VTMKVYEAQTLFGLGCFPVTDTYDYIELCNFLKLLSVSIYPMCDFIAFGSVEIITHNHFTLINCVQNKSKSFNIATKFKYHNAS
jgi:hypothetical protein